MTIADKPSNIRTVDWSVSGFYDIAVALEDKDHRLLIGSLHGFVFFVMMCCEGGQEDHHKSQNTLSPDLSVYND